MRLMQILPCIFVFNIYYIIANDFNPPPPTSFDLIFKNNNKFISLNLHVECSVRTLCKIGPVVLKKMMKM